MSHFLMPKEEILEETKSGKIENLLISYFLVD